MVREWDEEGHVTFNGLAQGLICDSVLAPGLEDYLFKIISAGKLYVANELESLDEAQPKNKRAKFNPWTKDGNENSYMAAWANIADQFNISHHHMTEACELLF